MYNISCDSMEHDGHKESILAGLTCGNLKNRCESCLK